MARKGAPKRGRLFFVLGTWLVFALASMPLRAEGPPNIIVVMADDHGQWALGSYGLEQLDTPNIDFLADQGVLF